MQSWYILGNKITSKVLGDMNTLAFMIIIKDTVIIKMQKKLCTLLLAEVKSYYFQINVSWF